MAGVFADRLHPLLGRADDRPAVARARAQLLDMLIAKQARQFLRRRVVVVDAHAGREAHRAIDDVEMLRAVAFERRKVEALQDAQREQELKALAGGRRHMHDTAAIHHRDRVLPFRRDLFEIAHRHVAAERFEMRDDRVAKFSAIEQLRAFSGEPFERAGKVRLREHPSSHCLVAAAQIIASELAVERRVRLQCRRVLVQLLDIELDQRKAVARERGRRLERIAQRFFPMRAHKFGPTAKVARHTRRQRPAHQILAPGEALDRKALRHARHEIEHADALLGGDPAGREPRAGKAGHVRLDDVERGRGCGRRVEGVAALRQHLRAGLRRERMRRRDHALGG